MRANELRFFWEAASLGLRSGPMQKKNRNEREMGNLKGLGLNGKVEWQRLPLPQDFGVPNGSLNSTFPVLTLNSPPLSWVVSFPSFSITHLLPPLPLLPTSSPYHHHLLKLILHSIFFSRDHGIHKTPKSIICQHLNHFQSPRERPRP